MPENESSPKPLHPDERFLSPSARAKRELAEMAHYADTDYFYWEETETGRKGTRKSHAPLGCGDFLYFSPRHGFNLLQVTGGGNGPARKRKILTECHANAVSWLASGGKIEVWCYRDRYKNGVCYKIEKVVLPVTMSDVSEVEA